MNLNTKTASEYGKRSSRKGIPNKTTAEIREAFHELIAGSVGQLHEDLTALEPHQRLKIVIDMSKYILPTLRATDLKVGSTEFNPIVISFQD
jgi:hypothetical protein